MVYKCLLFDSNNLLKMVTYNTGGVEEAFKFAINI